MHRTLVLALVAAFALSLAACGDDNDEGGAGGGTGTEEEVTPEPQGGAAATVKLTETEFKIDPAQLQVTKSGVIEFDVQNEGGVTHALEVEGNGVEEETEDIPAGQNASLKVELDPGSYELYCPIDGHKDKGMTGDLNVGLSRGTGGESEEEREREGEAGEDDSGGEREQGDGENESENEGESEDDGY
jgi:uncharacterized cupredoxin-like copper-binding protein